MTLFQRILISIFATVTLLSCTGECSLRNCSRSVIIERLNKELPTGTPRSKVIEFLVREGLTYSDQSDIFQTTPLGDDFTWISASIERSGFLDDERISIEFYFVKETGALVETRTLTNREF